MTTKDKRALLVKYLKEDALKSRGAWPRETKLINDLTVSYPDLAFWTWYNPGFKLNSVAWFLGEGKETLAAAHIAFEFDKLSKSRKVETTQSPEPFTVPEPNPNLRRNQTTSSWLRSN